VRVLIETSYPSSLVELEDCDTGVDLTVTRGPEMVGILRLTTEECVALGKALLAMGLS
jgi:hypothetical protein